MFFFFFFQAEDGIRDRTVTGVQTCALPILSYASSRAHMLGYGNINPLSIDYACRPRLRSRLTLGGLAWPRNPWSSGGRVSHSALATHACILTPTPSTPRSLGGFTGCRTLPYPPPHLDPPSEKNRPS